jgi:hypothetical protein
MSKKLNNIKALEFQFETLKEKLKKNNLPCKEKRKESKC